MAKLNLKNDLVYRVSDKGGAVRATIASNVATLTAVDVSVREVLVQATSANASAIRVNLYAAASAALGIQVPEATLSGAANADAILRLGVASLTALQFYGANDGDTVDVLWKN